MTYRELHDKQTVKKVVSNFVYEKSTDYGGSTTRLTVADGQEEWKKEYYFDTY